MEEVNDEGGAEGREGVASSEKKRIQLVVLDVDDQTLGWVGLVPAIAMKVLDNDNDTQGLSL